MAHEIDDRPFGIVHGGGDARQIGGQKMPRFIRLRALEPFIPNEITAGLIQPIEFTPPHGGRSVTGLPAILLPDICTVWLKAREEKALPEKQLATAQKAEIGDYLVDKPMPGGSSFGT